MKTIEEMKSFPAARKNYRPEKVEKLSEEQMKWLSLIHIYYGEGN